MISVVNHTGAKTPASASVLVRDSEGCKTGVSVVCLEAGCTSAIEFSRPTRSPTWARSYTSFRLFRSESLYAGRAALGQFSPSARRSGHVRFWSLTGHKPEGDFSPRADSRRTVSSYIHSLPEPKLKLGVSGF